jgi:hypothetical protein
MLTQQGMKILSELADIHRQDFLEKHEGYNENDVERDFLYTVLLKVSSHHETVYARLSNQIETIR